MKKRLFLLIIMVYLASNPAFSADSEAIGEELGKQGDKSKETIVTISSNLKKR